MARGPRPVYSFPGDSLPRVRKSPGQQTRAQEETRAHSSESLATRDVMNAGDNPKAHKAHDSAGARREQPKPYALWGYHVRIRHLKLGVLLLAERSLDRA